MIDTCSCLGTAALPSRLDALAHCKCGMYFSLLLFLFDFVPTHPSILHECLLKSHPYSWPESGVTSFMKPYLIPPLQQVCAHHPGHPAPIARGALLATLASLSPPCIVVLRLLSCVQLFVTLWTRAFQASLFSTIPCSLLKFMSIDLVILSNHLIPCHPLLLLPSVFPGIRVFSNESALCIRWPKY